jgi:triosephosphate isomerase
VGETRQEREDGKIEEVIEVQLRAAYEGMVWPHKQNVFIAYEPVWAVNTGEACKPEEAERMHQQIITIVKELLPEVSPIILYGGSVRAENASAYFEEPHVDGVLVGGASVKMDSWQAIVAAAQKINS